MSDTSDAFAEGVEAHDSGKLETSNPYEPTEDDHLSWNDGWLAAAEKAGE